MTINFKNIGSLIKVERTGYPDIYMNPSGNIQIIIRYYEDTSKWSINVGLEVANVLNDITDIQVDGVAVTDQADFETKIATVFPDANSGSSGSGLGSFILAAPDDSQWLVGVNDSGALVTEAVDNPVGASALTEITLTSPDDTQWSLSVTNTGALVTTAI